MEQVFATQRYFFIFCFIIIIIIVPSLSSTSWFSKQNSTNTSDLDNSQKITHSYCSILLQSWLNPNIIFPNIFPYSSSFFIFQGSDGSTAFHSACSQGSMDVVQLLFNEDRDICRANLQDNNGMTPLHQAAAFGNTPIVTFLLDQVWTKLLL